MSWHPTPGEQAMGQRYLRRDLSKRLQRWLCHLERLQLSRGHYLGGWSQVWRQMRGHWLDSAHGLWSQDLRQGRWLSHWKRLEEERELCAQTQKKSSDLLTCMLIGSHSLPHTCTPTYTLRFTHKTKKIMWKVICIPYKTRGNVGWQDGLVGDARSLRMPTHFFPMD